jgi:hypothetical protein
VLLAGTVLREQAGPVLPVRGDLDAVVASTLHKDGPGPNLLHRAPGVVDDPRILHIEHDPEPVNPAMVSRDAAIAQVEPEQVWVSRWQVPESVLLAAAV